MDPIHLTDRRLYNMSVKQTPSDGATASETQNSAGDRASDHSACASIGAAQFYVRTGSSCPSFQVRVGTFFEGNEIGCLLVHGFTGTP